MAQAMATRRKKAVLNNRKIKIFFNTIGVIASVLLAAFLVYVFAFPHDVTSPEIIVETTQNEGGSITFKTEEIFFDGTKALNLMEDVYIDDGKGNDITSEGSAIITAEGTVTKKIVSYTCLDAFGNTLTKKRTLVMENYSGPTLEIPSTLTLTAENLDNLIAYLQSEDLLVAYDGFGKNITAKVSHQREMISKENYKITFHVENEYGDEKKMTVNAKITGNVYDPDFELYENTVSVRKDSVFDPMKYVISQTSNVGYIATDSNVDTTVPGEYRVVYTAYSTDTTAKISKVMNVTVKESA